MNSVLVLTQNSGVLKPIAIALGYLMNGIYIILDNLFNIQNIALTIIVFTLVIYLFMLPLTYKQQKFSKMSQIMNPELQAVQKKYQGRRDQASMQKLQEEQQAVYRKYGVSPSGSCVFLAIQMLILFPLYRVINNTPAYIPRVKAAFDDVVSSIMATDGYQNTITSFLETIKEGNKNVFASVSLNFDTDTSAANSIIDVLYRCTADNWSLLKENFSGFTDVISSTQATVDHFNSFLGVSIAYSPKNLIATGWREGTYFTIFIAILIPVLSLASQFLNIRMMPQASAGGNAQQEQMANQMKTMNYLMPFYSFFLVFFLPVGVGLYWIAGALIRCVQQFVINRHFDRMDMEAVIKENMAKAAEKEKQRIEKKGVAGQQISNAARINTRNIDAPKPRSMADRAASVSKKDVDTSNKKYKEGSLASKANLVRDYNEKNSKSK